MKGQEACQFKVVFVVCAFLAFVHSLRVSKTHLLLYEIFLSVKFINDDSSGDIFRLITSEQINLLYITGP